MAHKAKQTVQIFVIIDRLAIIFHVSNLGGPWPVSFNHQLLRAALNPKSLKKGTVCPDMGRPKLSVPVATE
jgi:hypothetical protein